MIDWECSDVPPREISLRELVAIPTPNPRRGEPVKLPTFAAEDQSPRCNETEAGRLTKEGNDDVHKLISLSDLLSGCPNHQEPLSNEECTSQIDPTWMIQMPNMRLLVDDLLCLHPQRELDYLSWHDLLPEENRRAFSDLTIGIPQGLEAIEVYTDGSFKGKGEHWRCTWAFVVLGHKSDNLYLLGHGYGQVVTDPLELGWTGATEWGSRQAELDGQIHAMEWLFQQALIAPTTILYDSLSVGMMAQGLWTTPGDDLQAVLLRNLVCALPPFMQEKVPAEWIHVKSHTGLLGNEMADSLALLAANKHISCGGHSHIDYMPFLTGKPPAIHWLWWALSFPETTLHLPASDGADIFYSPLQIASTSDVKKNTAFRSRLAPAEKQMTRRLELHLVTYNVGTLRQRGKYSPTLMPKYLREQIAAHEIHILFLQETRANVSSLFQSDTHIRLVAAAENGRGGVEIWLLRRHPKTQRLLCHANQIVVLLAEAEILIAKVEYGGMHFILITAHAPHTGHEAATVRQFWARLGQQIRRFRCPDHQVLLGIDANAHFQWEKLPYIGPHGLEVNKNAAALHFAELLMDNDLFLPSTFDHIHSGTSWTWQNPANGSLARCDYLAIPMQWDKSVTSSWTTTTVDTGSIGHDHVPLHALVSLRYAAKIVKAQRLEYDRQALANAPSAQLQEIFQGLEIPTWQTDLDTHYVKLTDDIGKRLQDNFPKKGFQPRQSYISEDTWQIRLQRIRIARDIISMKRKALRLTTSWAFAVWHLSTEWTYNDILSNGLLLFFRIKKAQMTSFLLSKSLHRHLREGRVRYLEELAQRAESMPPRDFYQAMRQVGVAGRRYQRGHRPLPILLGEDGDTLETSQDIGARWCDYFAKQEAGVTLSFEELSALHDDLLLEVPEIPEWTQLPTLLELEQQFRHCQPLRAIFDDGLPGELLCRIPNAMAKAFYSLLLKISMYQNEPLMCRGGLLVPAYKGKGSAQECASYRSLFVSGTFGKAVHALYRKALVCHLSSYGMPLQIGGLPGKSTTQATHALLAMHGHTKRLLQGTPRTLD